MQTPQDEEVERKQNEVVLNQAMMLAYRIIHANAADHDEAQMALAIKVISELADCGFLRTAAEIQSRR